MNEIPTIAKLKYLEDQAKYPVPDWLWKVNINELPYRNWLCYVCQAFDAAVALEIGVEQGRTTAALACSVSELALGVEKTVRQDWIHESVDRMPPEHRHKVRILEGDSIAPEMATQVRATLNGRPIDLLYLDGIHSVEYVREELRLYGPLLAPVAVVACDDLNQPASLGEWFRERPAAYVDLDWLHMLHGHWGPPEPSCGFGALIVTDGQKDRLWE